MLDENKFVYEKIRLWLEKRIWLRWCLGWIVFLEILKSFVFFFKRERLEMIYVFVWFLMVIEGFDSNIYFFFW